MEKRLILAIALCIAVMIVWTKLFPVRPPAPAPAPAQTAPAAPEVANGTPAATSGTPAAGAPVAPIANRPEQKVEVLTPDVRFVFSSLGGTLLHAQLRGDKFHDRPGDPSSGHDLVTTLDPKEAALRTTFPDSNFPAPADGAWEVRQPAPNTVVFATDSGGVHIEKRYVADTTRYRLQLDVLVTNRGTQPVDHHMTLGLFGRQDPEQHGGGFFSGGRSANTASLICSLDDNKIERKPIEKLAKDQLAGGAPTAHWIAADEKFFLLAAVPYPTTPPRTCAARPAADGTGEVTLAFGSQTVAPGATVDYPVIVYAGPKVIADLEAVRPGNAEVELDKAVDVSLAWLSRPILSLLKFFYSFSKNWGLAIILLTLFIKVVTFPFTQKSLLSAKKMQKLTPKMNAIRKKYENDRQRQSIETMNLYKAHGVSPLGGCLPSLIQMPIWIALYSTLNYAVELYKAPFIAHIHDLTAKDPFYVTPLLMGGVMFLQMRMSPSGADQQQQQMMSLMMPIMFTGFSLFLPAGLALYMLTSYLLGILQQLYVNHLDRKGTVAA
jgi:YidC/Oxa1 family membrane protein insertase